MITLADWTIDPVFACVGILAIVLGVALFIMSVTPRIISIPSRTIDNFVIPPKGSPATLGLINPPDNCQLEIELSHEPRYPIRFILKREVVWAHYHSTSRQFMTDWYEVENRVSSTRTVRFNVASGNKYDLTAESADTGLPAEFYERCVDLLPYPVIRERETIRFEYATGKSMDLKSFLTRYFTPLHSDAIRGEALVDNLLLRASSGGGHENLIRQMAQDDAGIFDKLADLASNYTDPTTFIGVNYNFRLKTYPSDWVRAVGLTLVTVGVVVLMKSFTMNP
ncbi:hypothetical protein HED60_02720 [Planctomycetales bacterium ZRK34]|nr:hypothetical protein HED60_02720 [Planctomycetales bacterium ZRK34]